MLRKVKLKWYKHISGREEDNVGRSMSTMGPPGRRKGREEGNGCMEGHDSSFSIIGGCSEQECVESDDPLWQPKTGETERKRFCFLYLYSCMIPYNKFLIKLLR